jgi:hypothetical protein
MALKDLAGAVARAAARGLRRLADALARSFPEPPAAPPGGPPPHWVERVRRAAPHLLRPPLPRGGPPAAARAHVPGPWLGRGRRTVGRAARGTS